MKTGLLSIALLLILTPESGAEILWQWDMTALPGGWTANQYWQFDSEGAHSYVSSSGASCDATDGSQSALMVSDTLTVPPGLDCVIVGLDTDWEYDGWWTTGESSCNIWFRIMVVGGGYHTVVFSSHHWGFDRMPALSDGVTTEVIPLTGGDEFYLQFSSYAGSSFGAYAEMAWDVADVFIADSSGTALQMETWAEIKNLFI